MGTIGFPVGQSSHGIAGTERSGSVLSLPGSSAFLVGGAVSSAR
ncbi:hypothetical protein [Amycolatopsis sp. WAC 04169]|nr:hypothetical protein [Amycolatopsis sp. WAC 04169]